MVLLLLWGCCWLLRVGGGLPLPLPLLLASVPLASCEVAANHRRKMWDYHHMKIPEACCHHQEQPTSTCGDASWHAQQHDVQQSGQPYVNPYRDQSCSASCSLHHTAPCSAV